MGGEEICREEKKEKTNVKKVSKPNMFKTKIFSIKAFTRKCWMDCKSVYIGAQMWGALKTHLKDSHGPHSTTWRCCANLCTHRVPLCCLCAQRSCDTSIACPFDFFPLGMCQIPEARRCCHLKVVQNIVSGPLFGPVLWLCLWAWAQGWCEGGYVDLFLGFGSCGSGESKRFVLHDSIARHYVGRV